MLNINEKKMYKPKIKMNENDDTIKKKKKSIMARVKRAGCF